MFVKVYYTETTGGIILVDIKHLKIQKIKVVMPGRDDEVLSAHIDSE